MSRDAELIRQRKALLIVRCDLERVRLRLALRRAQGLLTPGSGRSEPGRRWLWLLRTLLVAGQNGRLGKLASAASMGMLLYRTARGWRKGRDRKG
jgi:hypothetical protein